MKRINLAVATILLTILFSCQKNSSETTNADSLTVDTALVSNTPPDTTAVPTETEFNADEDVRGDDMDPADYDYTYEGTINNTIKVKVNLFNIRGEEHARLVYLNSKKIINMDSKYLGGGDYELTEKIDGKPTGFWKIGVEEEDILSGTWTSPDGKKQLPIALGMTNEDFDNFLKKEEIITGFYELKEVNEDVGTKEEFPLLYLEELYVKNMANNSIYFDLNIQGSPPGMHVGMVNGIANKSGNYFIYKNDNGCEISMLFSGDVVKLSQKGSDMDCEFGASIGAFGTLQKKK